MSTKSDLRDCKVCGYLAIGTTKRLRSEATYIRDLLRQYEAALKAGNFEEARDVATEMVGTAGNLEVHAICKGHEAGTEQPWGI